MKSYTGVGYAYPIKIFRPPTFKPNCRVVNDTKSDRWHDFDIYVVDVDNKQNLQLKYKWASNNRSVLLMILERMENYNLRM